MLGQPRRRQSVQSISEILQTMARQRGRGDTSPLLAFLPVEGAGGERIAHLPLDGELAQAWVALTGEPFRPHQAHALTALRRGEPVALRAASADSGLTGFLLLYAALLADRSATALIVAPDETQAQAVWGRVAQINAELPKAMQLNALPLAPNRRPDGAARVVIASPTSAHSRLLRHHDRGWANFWSRLQFVMLPELQQLTGVATAHIADILFRIQRVAEHHSGQRPSLLALLQDVAEAEPTLASLLGQPWRIVQADDGPRTPNALAIWRGGAAWRRDAADLATAFQRQGYQVHLVCRPLERALFAPIIGDLPRVTFGPELAPAQVLIAAGFPAGHSAIRRMLRSGCQAVVIALGELPHEQALARQAQLFPAAPPSAWVAPAPNAYILARHVLCAASELPLTESEVAAWNVADIVERLAGQGELVDLPDAEVAWKPTEAADDPYAEWSVHSASGAAYPARNEQALQVGAIEPALAERWAFPQAALPPGAGGFRVIARDADTGALTLRFDSSGRRTYPLRRCTVTVRDTRETRALAGGRALAWGRVIAEEAIYGYRELSSSGAPADIALPEALGTRWAAPACWLELPPNIQSPGQLIGWSLASALQMRALADFTDVTPCYDASIRRLYLVDTQPGGNGLSAWVFANAEELLPLAYDVALACRNDPLLEPLSRVDMDWLLLLLGRAPAAPPEPPSRPAPRQVEYIEAPPEPRRRDRPAPRDEPPPAPRDEPRILVPPAPRDEPPPAPRDEPRILVPPAPREEPRRAERPAPRDEPPRDEPPPERIASRPTRVPEPPAPRDEPHRAERPAPRDEPPPAPRDEPRASRAPEPPKREPATPPTQRGLPIWEPPAEPQKPPAEPPARNGAGQRGTPPEPPADEPAPDAQALIDRLRRQRQQREAQLGLAKPREAPPRMSREPAERRFSAGDRVFCLPYGDGEVRASRIEDGRELLQVAFPDLGELTIDPAVSLVRKLEDAPESDDDLL